MRDDIDTYLSGKQLYGDDFDAARIAEWFAHEREAYADLGAKDQANYRYAYHAWNVFNAYRHLPNVSFAKVLGFGSAYGDELRPIISRIGEVTVADPSDAFAVSHFLDGVPVVRVKPDPTGNLPFANDSFDLVTCLGVLHHIPNVSFVVGELARTLKVGGFLVLREPIVSMGDWRRPRPGLTKRERGIPLGLLEGIVQRSGLKVRHRALCGFPLTSVFRVLRPDFYNSRGATWVDSVLSRIFAWNVNYHPRNWAHRFRPTAVYLVLQK